MRYLITHPDHKPFFSAYFDAENHFAEGMTGYDIFSKLYTTDGKTWKPVQTDHL